MATAIESIGGCATFGGARTRCAVCGFSEVRTDEVLDGASDRALDRTLDRALDRGWMFLAECPRCEHRWTSREPIAAARSEAREPVSSVLRVERAAFQEVRPAA